MISHYNAWSADKLIALLDQTCELPAGCPFHTRVVVNAAFDKPLLLPARHAAVEILYRENMGYNVGAWDHGWRSGVAFDAYVFLQEECVLLRPGWMAALLEIASLPRVGLVGESLVWERPWSELEATQDRSLNPLFCIDGRQVDRFACYYENLRRLGVERGADGRHLQSLVLAARREVLDRLGSLPLGSDYGAAVAAEIALSKKVKALGLQVRQVAWLPFTYVLHPQWKVPRWRQVLGQTLVRWLPSPFRQVILVAARRGRTWISR